MRGVLVDSSIWIDYLRNGNVDDLSVLIEDDIAIVNELILTEILPFARLERVKALIAGLNSVKKAELDINWQGLRALQVLNLRQGVNRVGIPDLIIAQQALQLRIELWTKDKHFKRMSDFLELRLYVPNLSI